MDEIERALEKLDGKLDSVGTKLDKIGERVFILETNLSNHHEVEKSHGQRVGDLEQRIAKLEVLQERAQGAAWAIRVAVAIAIAASGAAGWLLKHMSVTGHP